MVMLFVCGTGRCGKSIVAETIARHPNIAALPFESRFIIDPDGIIDFYASYSSTWSYYLCDRRLKRLEKLLKSFARRPPWYHRLLSGLIRLCNPSGRILSLKAYDRWELNKHIPGFSLYSKMLMSALTSCSYSACWFGAESYRLFPKLYHAPPMTKEKLAIILGAFLEAIIESFLDKHDAVHFVDSNVFTIQLARELIEILPEAKILHVYRDPRDVIASYVNQRWCPKNKAQAAHIYKNMMRHWWNIRDDLPPDSYTEFRFETFISYPREYLESTCEFYGLPFDSAMLDVDLSRHHIGRWKDEYTLSEWRGVHDILGDIIERMGYKVE